MPPQPPRLRPLVALLALASLLALAPPVDASEPLPSGSSILYAQAAVLADKLSATVEGFSPVPCPELFSVFADFESMPSFVPGLHASHVVSRGEGWAVIQQSGSLRFGPLSQAFASERKVLISPPSRIESASTGRPGEPQVASTTTFLPDPGGCRTRYSTQIELPAWAPGLVAAAAAKSNAALQMASMLREAHRRHRAISLQPDPSDPPVSPAEPNPTPP